MWMIEWHSDQQIFFFKLSEKLFEKQKLQKLF